MSANETLPEDTPGLHVGMPAALKLNLFGDLMYHYFNETAYLVGSAARTKRWRDVDVRVMLDDEDFERRFGKTDRGFNRKLDVLTLAFATLARELTGLPVDFQIQPRTYANETYGSKDKAHWRIPLISSLRMEQT